jgi:signal transduction histidine kinase
LRGRLQRLVDRRFYPLRGAAVAAIERLHRDISEGTARPEALEGVLREALRDPALRVGFRVSAPDACVDAQSNPVPDADGEPVLLEGSQVGVIVPGGGHGEASVELVRAIAGRAATIVEMVRLRLELAGTLREVELSRARLVQSGYDERRRLERDLHDGAQQRLVSLGMALRLAQRHLDDGSVDVNDLLDQSVAELGTAVAELRQLAHGIRPSSLDDGLPAAVARLVRTVPVTVELDVDSGELPDDVATTAYFVISESLANAVKHSEASHIGLSVARRNGEVVVRVTDDGRGGAVLRPESGLADRVAALGGSVDVVSRNGHGTVVEAVMPCAS